jgi:monofunctional biosynthetic peptidoglycan transglycosylase
MTDIPPQDDEPVAPDIPEQAPQAPPGPSETLGETPSADPVVPSEPEPYSKEPVFETAADIPPPPDEPISQPEPPKRRKRGVWRLILLVVLCAGLIGPVAMTAIYRFVPPPVTILMLLRAIQGHGLDYRWRGLNDISPDMVQAAIASEDTGFCRHHGFDFAAMRKAMAHNEKRPGKIRGGSTISQQTAKNVFLWPDRTYIRKGLEAYFTVLTEAIWGKRRIMEVYLNVVEMGPGIYGAEAASQAYFGHSAKTLDRTEADHLIAILPSPLKWKAVHSGAYVQRRSARIDARAGIVKADGLAGCVAD